MYGIHSKNGKFYIGDSQISIQDDDITIRDKTYTGTPRLWELITMREPDKSLYNKHDKAVYSEILNATNAIRQPNNPKKPKSSKGKKYNEIIKPM